MQRKRVLVVIRKRGLLLAFFSFLLLCYVARLTVSMTALVSTREVYRSSIRGKTIAIDPGHGGIDGGASDPATGLVEKDINLDFARALKSALTRAGAKAVLTRKGDNGTLGDLSPAEDCDKRLKEAEAHNADVYVSIHVNSFPDSSCFGAQTFYLDGSEEGRRLALLIQEEVVRIRPENFREAATGDFYVLRNSKMPAILLEIGFITNPEDRRLMADAGFTRKMAEAVSFGIARYFAGDLRPRLRERGSGAGLWQ